MARVLIATPESISRRLTGRAIRAAHIARVLSATHDVTLVSTALGPTESSRSPIDGRVVLGPAAINTRFDAAIISGNVLSEHQRLLTSTLPLVVDWFDPFHTEALHPVRNELSRRRTFVEDAHHLATQQAERGDYFLVSNEAQRDHWLGWLGAAGRLNHINHDHDAEFNQLIGVAPFGLGREAPSTAKPIRKAFDAVGFYDPVVLWAGGMHEWLDPLMVIESVPYMLEENPDTRLVFLAGPHPNTSIETMGVRGEAITLARRMRLFGKHVMFVNQWVDYRERLTWLQDADVGVVADGAHLESRYSHRTRLLDHLGAGLPTVSTSGDPMSSQLEAAGAAITCARTPEALGEAVRELISDDKRLGEMSRAAKALGARLSWEETLKPLITWLEDPKEAPDRQKGAFSQSPDGLREARIRAKATLGFDDGGVAGVAKRGWSAGRRKLGR